MHGVWPPPEPTEEPMHRGTGRHRYETSPHHYQPFDFTYPSPMFSAFPSASFGGGHHPRSHFHFTDPFTLFDSIFGDFQRAGLFQFPHHHGETLSHPRHHEYLTDDHHHYEDPRRAGYAGTHHRRHTHSQGSSFPPAQSSGVIYQSESHGYSRNGRWTQESRMTSTVNGVTQSVWKRTDADVCHPRVSLVASLAPSMM